MKTLLLVDDTKENIDILINLLHKEYNLIVANSGKEALQKAQDVNIDLILLSIIMPIMDGYEVCKRLKQNKDTKNIPIIFATEKTDEDSIVKAYDAGAVDYIAKPFRYKEMVSRINQELNLQQSKKELNFLNNNLEEQIALRTSEIVNLNKEIEDTQKEVIFTMGAIGESRSKETANHVKRVAKYSKIIALNYGFSKQEAELLKQASPMHDIGKIGISDNILKKNGKLTQDEYKIMKTHTTLGYEMLKASKRPLLKLASTIAYEHHEKWDGGGYPQGLIGENINIFARITTVADVFDALASKRIYKPSWTDEHIFTHFKEQKGKDFDPKIIDIFFESLDEILEIRDALND